MHAENLITRFFGMKGYGPDPFGAPLVVVGEEAEGNLFRFSTKYADDQTGLMYYGQRYYSAQVGRWLSTDPMEEASFVITRGPSPDIPRLVQQVGGMVQHRLGMIARMPQPKGVDASDQLLLENGINVLTISGLLATVERAFQEQRSVLQSEQNAYLFVRNSPPGFIDAIGLLCLPWCVHHFKPEKFIVIGFGKNCKYTLFQTQDFCTCPCFGLYCPPPADTEFESPPESPPEGSPGPWPVVPWPWGVCWPHSEWKACK